MLKTTPKDTFGIDPEGILVDLNSNGVLLQRFSPYANLLEAASVDTQITAVRNLEKTINATVYPNLANNTINIEVEKGEAFTSILLDLNRRIITTSTTNFNVSELANGIYLIKVATAIGCATFKVSVSH